MHKSQDEWQMISDNGGNPPLVLGLFPGTSDVEMETASQWLEMQKEISRIKEAQEDESTFASYVNVHDVRATVAMKLGEQNAFVVS